MSRTEHVMATAIAILLVLLWIVCNAFSKIVDHRDKAINELQAYRKLVFNQTVPQLSDCQSMLIQSMQREAECVRSNQQERQGVSRQSGQAK